ncbi:MAG: arylsulfotransferase family protein, partial [Pseudomonadota bacterium]|nr:arylsulfotransferase family protein [Pseudomonadota bacterium]
LNDVEPLPAALADAFPMFNAGDLLVSLRNTNLVAVIDRRSHRIKWAENGAWLRQHDPDFMSDGRIIVFDNRKDDANGRVFGGSRILAIDPADGQVEVLFEGTEKAPFYTNVMGQQQRQPNGNLLISEPQAGRAIEVTPAGKIVWQYVNGYTPGINALMEMAYRYPLAYGEFADTPCP